LYISERDNSQVAYLMAFLMLLHVEEAMNLEFEGIDAIPGEGRCHVLRWPPSKADILFAGEYFDIKLKMCKSVQTGLDVLHIW
jgi:hypothetical protein